MVLIDKGLLLDVSIINDLYLLYLCTIIFCEKLCENYVRKNYVRKEFKEYLNT